MEAHESAAKCVSISTKKTGDEGLQGYMVQTVLRWILFFFCQLPLAMHANKNKRLQRSIPQNGLPKKNVPLRCGHAVLLLLQGNEGPRSIWFSAFANCKPDVFTFMISGCWRFFMWKYSDQMGDVPLLCLMTGGKWAWNSVTHWWMCATSLDLSQYCPFI